MEMEDIWVQRELGDELFKQCNQLGYELVYIRSSSTTLPSDIYCRCDIYVDIEDPKQSTWFALKYTNAVPVEKIERNTNA